MGGRCWANSIGFNLGCRIVLSYTYSQEENTKLVTHTFYLSLSHRCAYKRILSNALYLYKEKSILKAHTIANLWLGQKKLLYIHENNTQFHFKKRKKQKGRLANWIQKG